MRLAVLDIGSNSAHLRIVDAYPGSAPLPLYRHKAPTRLAETVDEDGVLRPEGIARVLRAGLRVGYLTGEEEARLTYFDAHRWFGWSSGPLLLVDIGGGSMEIVAGRDEDPSFVVSLPLGAGRLTRSYLNGRGRSSPARSPPSRRCGC